MPRCLGLVPRGWMGGMWVAGAEGPWMAGLPSSDHGKDEVLAGEGRVGGD